MPTTSDFLSIVEQGGSSVLFHRSPEDNPCPCRTPEGYRDPIWHLQHPDEAMCNEAGFLPSQSDVTISIKGFVQPIQSTRATRLRSERVLEDFAEVETGDHLGIFPATWAGVGIDFSEWGVSGEDYVEWEGRRLTVVHANIIADPDGGEFHHWEVGLRQISKDPL
jgi:hypothetical protein